MNNFTKTTIGNVCFIIDKKNQKVLLLNRNRPPMQNMCTGVGGKTNFDEDIQASCIREVKEETGLDVTDVKLKAVIKTILQDFNSAWILFVYTAENFSGNLIECPEGELKWVELSKIYEEPLIGFIKLILSHVLEQETILEGTIWHDMQGKVLKEQLNFIYVYKVGQTTATL